MNLEEGKKKKKKTSCESFRIVMTHNPAKFRFTTLKNQGAKVRRRKVTGFAGISSYEYRTQQYQLLTAVTHE